MEKFGDGEFSFHVDEKGEISNMVGRKDVVKIFMAEMVSQSIKTGLNADESCQVANNALRALAEARKKQPEKIWQKLWQKIHRAFFWGVWTFLGMFFPIAAYLKYGWNWKEISAGWVGLGFLVGMTGFLLVADYCIYWLTIGIKAGIGAIKARRLKARQQSTAAEG